MTKKSQQLKVQVLPQIKFNQNELEILINLFSAVMHEPIQAATLGIGLNERISIMNKLRALQLNIVDQKV